MDDNVARVEVTSKLGWRATAVDRLFFELSYGASGAQIARSWVERTIREPLT